MRDVVTPVLKRHLLSIDDLTREQAILILDTADELARISDAPIKKLPTLRGRTVVNLFYEDSTRTRISFEAAAKRLSADVINFSAKGSSVSKGESLKDTALTLQAMGADAVILRHSASGAAHRLAEWTKGSVINAGDGTHEHPTQALLDALTLKRSFGHIEGLVVAICGDVLHSRVARSNVILLSMLGARVRLIAPPTLMPADVDRWGCEIYHNMLEGLDGVDVVMMLRLQLERMNGAYVPSAREYFRFYGLDARKLAVAAPHVKVMHPGPMNRGVEIDSDIADDPRVSLIVDQVESGVAVRMAVLEALASHGVNEEADDV